MGRLFDVPDDPPGRSEPPAEDLPLAARMRPRTLEEFVGQTHLLGPSSALRTGIQSGEPHSMILYGPPGTGKTTLARMSAEYADAAFEELSAVEGGGAGGGAGGSRGQCPAPASPAAPAATRSSSWMRSTASTRPSRTRCCPRSRRASSCSSGRPGEPRTSGPTPP